MESFSKQGHPNVYSTVYRTFFWKRVTRAPKTCIKALLKRRDNRMMPFQEVTALMVKLKEK